jgi:hypothetical protein
MLCDTHVCPLYPSPVQLFQAHVIAVPTATVLDAGLNTLFVTETPLLAGGGVFTPGEGLVVLPPLPPHPNRQATAAVVKTCFNIFVSIR